MIGFVLAGMILSLGWDSPTSRSPIDPKILSCVSQLGHKSFRVREQASKELIQAGLVAMPAVRAGAMSSNPEIADRCQRLIPEILQVHRNRQIDVLLKSAKGPVPKDLPGLERFLSITDDTFEARQFYAEMAINHHKILESLENNPNATADLMAVLIQQIIDNAIIKTTSTHKPREDCVFEKTSEVVMFLFIRGDRRFKSRENIDNEEILVWSNFLKNLVLGSKSSPTVKKLFFDWYRNEQRPELLTCLTGIVLEGKMKELLPAMLKWLAEEQTPVSAKSQFLTAVARLGDKRLIEYIEKLITDKTPANSMSWKDPQGNDQVTELLVGDIALNVCWYWAGQKHRDLGMFFPFPNHGDHSIFRNDACFINEGSRQAAHAKWKKLRAEMLKADEKQDKK